jgi:small conductance mechanosensitive channel
MDDLLEQELKQVTGIYELVTEFLVSYSFQLVDAVIVFFLGYLVARKISQVVLALCLRKNIDVTLSGFIANVVKILLTMATIIALGKLGISVTPFVGAIGLGAGLAVQGLLSNYGAGLNIILARPFVVGETITVQGVSGQVKEVHLAYTVLADEDNVKITVPNRHIVGKILHNSQADSILELGLGIAYDSDPRVALEAVLAALQSVEGIRPHCRYRGLCRQQHQPRHSLLGQDPSASRNAVQSQYGDTRRPKTSWHRRSVPPARGKDAFRRLSSKVQWRNRKPHE